MPKNILHNAYTNTPEQHPNLILGSLQLLFWLFFRPTAWHNHLKRIDPALYPLSRDRNHLSWRSPGLLRLLIQGYIVLPLLAHLILSLIFLFCGEQASNIAIRIVSSMVSGTLTSVLLSIVSNLIAPEIFAVFFCVTFYMGLGVAFGIVFGEPVVGVISAAFAEVSSGRNWNNRFTSRMLLISSALMGTSSIMMAVNWGWMLGEFLGFQNIASNSVSGVPGMAALIFALLLGVTINFWRPILCYPFQTIWNYLLYAMDKGFINNKPSLLHWHSAFSDEWQYIHLFGLDQHLLLVIDHEKDEGFAATKFLIKSRQYWAVEAVLIELKARRLEECIDVTAISKAHENLILDESRALVSPILRIFTRISKDVEAALNQVSSYNQRLALTVVANLSNEYLHELIFRRDKYTVRFYPIVENWHGIITNHIKELTQATELRQEIDSPYISGVPLTQEQKIFTGRTDIATRIEQLIFDRRRPPLLLYGQRRMGKTSLLNNIGKLLPNSIIPIFVDLQGAPSSASDYTGFLYNLAKGMITSAKQQSALTLPTLTRKTLADDPFTRFDEWLDQVEEALEQNTALLMLDEFETLDSAITRGRFDEQDVLGMLRHLIQHRTRFKVLLAGSHTIEEYQRWASYLINVQVVHISYLKEEEARQLIEHPVKDFTLRYEPDAVERVLQLTRCHPFLIQLLCGEIIVLKNEQDPSIRRLATLADVEAAAPEALQSGSFFFADMQNNQVDASGRDILRFIAAQGKGEIVSKLTLSQQFSDVWERTIELLLQRELIEEVGEGYRFQVELIRLWFTR
ncbi:AAA family ATPase [Anabaena minutissima FACHB-250]|nr:AAA family ATPase [Anabaena minutissima FACHB-250]